ncbi:MAG: hypothetical protein SGI72_17740 [Planctomycetota bacterium]|nr:hypothetical protein [Planctomycetota bacterium]
MNTDIRSLEARLQSLEVQNRRLKKWSLVAGGALATLTMFGAAAPLCDIVTGERLVIRDSSNRTRVGIDAYHTETPGVTMHDKSGRERAKLSIDDKGDVTLSFTDEKGAAQASYLFAANGAPKADAPKTGEDKPVKNDPSLPTEATTVFFGSF